MPKETSAFYTYSLIFILKKKHLYFKKKTLRSNCNSWNTKRVPWEYRIS